MRNRFSCKCFRCGETVAAERGLMHFANLPGKWWPQLRGTRSITLVQHDACAAKYHNTNVHWQYAPDPEEDVQVVE